MIFIVGCGTLGSKVAHLLADKQLALIDHDVVYEHNLATQEYTRRDVGTQKVYALLRVLPGVRTHNVFLDQTNLELLREAEVVVDCTDNLLTRELLDAYCYHNGIPLVHAAAAKKRGVAGLFTGKPCLRCVYHNKVSLENCRGNEIDQALARLLAQTQERFVRAVLRGEEHHELYLVYPDRLEELRVAGDCSVCEQPVSQEAFYITWCPQAQCLSAKRLQPLEVRIGSYTIGSVTAHVQRDGEIHFSGSEDVDALKAVAKQIYASLS